MADLLFAGASAAVLLFLLQQNASTTGGVTEEAQDDVDTMGTVIPPEGSNYAEVDDEHKVSHEFARYDIVNDENYEAWYMSREGTNTLHDWAVSHGMKPFSIEAYNTYYLVNISKTLDAKTLKKMIGRVADHTSAYQQKSIMNNFMPGQQNRYRRVANKNPLLPSFLGSGASIGAKQTSVEDGPYVLWNHQPIGVHDRLYDGIGYRAEDNTVHVNLNVDTALTLPPKTQGVGWSRRKIDRAEITFF